MVELFKKCNVSTTRVVYLSNQMFVSAREMERKSFKPIREPSRMEKIKAATSTQMQQTPLVKLKEALKSKPIRMIFFGLAGILTLKIVVKPWYDKKRAQDAEDYANFLWEKSNKNQ